MEVADYGVLSVPGLVMNEIAAFIGRIPRRETMAQWAHDAAAGSEERPRVPSEVVNPGAWCNERE